MTAYAMNPVMTGQRPVRRAVPARSSRPARLRVQLIQTPAARARRRGVLVAMVLAAVAIVAPQAFANDDSAPPVVFDTYTVSSGETVWSIAAGITPAGVDVRDVVEDIITLNAMGGSALQAGEQLLLPEVG
ncbi:LysM peptidoglycan-binding domain-containing protein [Demequina activiva]|uniref:LysM domain-containing protein n=1 Tax=Demequina activiva TaxID=1582364 RepID=A0A919UJD5_9MICO|nr:LysM peptidoglycan-binding domain-containing protein [Demequina activiva]GIG54266.1 hypothetical protein Dac01nite_10180 [Demequina activiva]